MAGYGFEMFKSRGRDFVYAAVLLTMMIPFAALMVPVFRLMTFLNLIDSLWGVILPMIPSVFLIFFFRQNLQQYPKKLLWLLELMGQVSRGFSFLLSCPR
jgi:lactose/L-arabinose transport system permease protein